VAQHIRRIFSVDWGDTSSSTITSYDDADRTHSYSGAGTYTVVLNGTCEWFAFNNLGDKTLVVELNEFTGVIFIVFNKHEL